MKNLIILLIVFLLSCATVEKKLFVDETPQRRRAHQDIEVSYSFPQKDHIQIAQLQLQYNSGYTRKKVLFMLKSEAADLGGDGIKIESTEHYNDSWGVNARAGERSNQLKSNHRKIKVIVFRYQ